jgi:Glycosyl transferase family 2
VRGEAPTISVGLPVRNARDVVGRCLDSILSQDLADLELVVSDNASDDGTQELLADYARSDARIRLNVNETNVGIHENVNRVLELARGKLYRLISSDDWLEPGYLSTCVGALQARDDAIGVTTDFTVHVEGGLTRAEQYNGEFPTSTDPARRFERMLWFFRAGDGKYDPIYGVYRRDVLLRARRQYGSEHADWLLAADLALRGPIIHRHARLAHRSRPRHAGFDRAALRRRLDPGRPEALESSARRLYLDLLELVLAADLTDEQVRRCKRALRLFWVREVMGRGRTRLAEARHRLFSR